MLKFNANEPKIKEKIIKSKTVKAYPNAYQKVILYRWFNAYIIMYNETINKEATKNINVKDVN